MSEHQQEITANLHRAEQSLHASHELTELGYYDIAASRAYYAAFYCSTAVLLREGSDFSKHSGVIASIHQRFVKTGKLSRECGKNLSWLFELRNIGDYGGTAHVSPEQAERAVQAAESFLVAIKELLAK